MTENIIFSIHIEKCGGTSIRDCYHQLFGADKTIIYKPNRHPDETYHRSSDYPFDFTMVTHWRTCLGQHPTLLAAFNTLHTAAINRSIKHTSLKEIIKEPAAVVHGHQIAQIDYDHGISPIHVTVLREPFARTISHYQYWKARRGKTDFQTQIPFNEEVSFDDFFHMPELINFQSKRLEGVPLAEYAAIGTISKIEEFIHQVKRISLDSGIPVQNNSPTEVSCLNPSPKSDRKPTHFSQFSTEFSGLNQLDYELYHQYS